MRAGITAIGHWVPPDVFANEWFEQRLDTLANLVANLKAVSPGQRILMFHDPADIWVEANVRETEMRLLKPGLKAEVRVDAYPGKVFAGEDRP